MTHASAIPAAATLSSRSVRSTRLDAVTPPGARQLLSDEARTLDFRLVLATGEELRGTLTGSGKEPTWLWLVLDALRRLSELSPDWDSYGAQPPHERAISRCLQFLSDYDLLFEWVPEPTIVPTRDGGIQLEWHGPKIEVEVAVPPTGPISYLISDAISEVELEGEGECDRRALSNALRGLAQPV